MRVSAYHLYVFVLHMQCSHDTGVIAPRTGTPAAIIDLALDLAEVRDGDLLVDVGSNDARVLLRAVEFVARLRDTSAAKAASTAEPESLNRHRLRCIGVEIDEEACAGAADRVAKAGLDDSIEIVCGDILADGRASSALAMCDVLFMFMAPKGHERLKRKIAEDCKPGTRIVSYLFPLHGQQQKKDEMHICDDPFDGWFVRSESLPSTRPSGIDVSSFSTVHLYRIASPAGARGAKGTRIRHVPRMLSPPEEDEGDHTLAEDEETQALRQFRLEAAAMCASLGVLGFDENYQDCTCERIHGGITNSLAKLTPSDASVAAPVVVRIFGPGSDAFINRAHEHETVLQLSSHGLGARVLGTFENGRVERYIGGSARVLNYEDIIDAASGAPARRGSVLRAMAKLVRSFHECDVHTTDVERSGADCERSPGACDALWRTMRKFYEAAMRHTGDGRLVVNQGCAGDADVIDINTLWEDVEKLRKVCDTFTTFQAKYTHNDLLLGNFLIECAVEPKQAKAGKLKLGRDYPSTPKIHLIDFEYSHYGSLCYDLANMFNEFAGFECAWERRPDETVMRSFLVHYFDDEDDEKRRKIDAAMIEIKVYILVRYDFRQ